MSLLAKALFINLSTSRPPSILINKVLIQPAYLELEGHGEVCRSVPLVVWILDGLLCPAVLEDRTVWRPSDGRGAERTLHVAPPSLLEPLGNNVPWQSPQQI